MNQLSQSLLLSLIFSLSLSFDLLLLCLLCAFAHRTFRKWRKSGNCAPHLVLEFDERTINPDY